MKLKWTIGILVPNLVKDEVGIHLYEPAEIDQLDSGFNDEHIILFIVCKSGENSYWAKHATISQETTMSPSEDTTNDLFLGTTLLLPRGQQNFVAFDSVKGNLRDFSQWSTTIQ